MKNIWIKFNDLPIFFRLLCVIVIATGILCFFSVSNYIYISEEKMVNIKETVQRSGRETAVRINEYMSDISNISKIPLTYRMEDESYINALKDYNDCNCLTLEFQRMNERMFEEIMAYKTDINSCFIFNKNGCGDYKVKNAIYSVMNPTEEAWFQECYEKHGKPVVVDTYEMPYVADSANIPLWVFGVARGILKIETNEVVGVLLITTEIDYIRNIVTDNRVSENQRVIIVDGTHTIYDTNEEYIGQQADDKISGIESKESGEVNEIILQDGEHMLAFSIVSDVTGWRIISLVPKDEVLGELKVTQQRIIVQTILGIGIMLVLLFLIIARISKSIGKLEAVMKLAEQGNFEQHVKVESKDEIGNLTGMFNSMIERINNLINEVYKQKIYHSEMELQMLQAQINPHFLYNALESISMLAVMNDDDQTSEMAANLGHIMRYGISNYNVEVTLYEEIFNLKKYIAFQEMRFKSIYTISIDISPELYSIKMIKMIIQPILENAIYHGMKDTVCDGKITISAGIKSKNVLEFVVADNGGGMTAEEVLDLNDYIQGNNHKYKSIGLRNVNRRIKLQYGENYGLTVESCKGQGTTVYATIYIDSHLAFTEGEGKDADITG